MQLSVAVCIPHTERAETFFKFCFVFGECVVFCFVLLYVCMMHLLGDLRASDGGFRRLCGEKKVDLQLKWLWELLAVTQELPLAKEGSAVKIPVAGLRTAENRSTSTFSKANV